MNPSRRRTPPRVYDAPPNICAASLAQYSKTFVAWTFASAVTPARAFADSSRVIVHI